MITKLCSPFILLKSLCGSVLCKFVMRCSVLPEFFVLCLRDETEQERADNYALVNLNVATEKNVSGQSVPVNQQCFISRFL